MMMTPNEIDAFDQRNAAIHEAGHLTVAWALGISARAWITRRPTGPEYKTWGGQCECAAHPAVAVAGLVAESIMDEPDASLHWVLEDIEEHLLQRTISETDAAMLGPIKDADEDGLDEALVEAVDQAFRAILEYRHFFDWAVATLIDQEVITDGMASEAFASRSAARYGD